MKLSKWNSYVDISDKFCLIYNSFSDQFVLIEKNSVDYASLQKGDVDCLSNDTKKNLLDIRAIVDVNIDEINELSETIINIDNDDSIFQLIVNPTLDCNFYCWYCYENHQRKSMMNADLTDALIILAKNRIDIQKRMKQFHLSFFGGEPLICFDEVVLPVIKGICELCKVNDKEFSVNFTTNAYLLSDSMIEKLNEYKPSFQITLDGGKRHHDNTRFTQDKEPSFDIIIENIRKLSEAHLHIIVRINYTTGNIDSTSEIIDILEDFPQSYRKFIRVDYQRVWQDDSARFNINIEDKVENFRKRLRKAGYVALNSKLNNHVRNSCYGDKANELLVNFNGDVFACTARDFKTENRLGFLTSDGKVEWNEELIKIRRACRFSKQVCHDCRIAPLCGGGCRTKCMEHAGHDKCNLGFTQEDIDNIILDKFEARYMGY